MATTDQSEEMKRLINIEGKLDRALALVANDGMPVGNQPFGSHVYSQHGEDFIAANIFGLLGIDRPTYIDIGAHHPLRDSNTALFYRRGCRGINIEANPDLIEEFRRLRPHDVNVHCGIGPQKATLDFYRIDRFSGRNTFDQDTAQQFVAAHSEFKIQDVIKVDVVTLADIVTQHAGGTCPDFLSIDIEGLDYAVLASVDFKVIRPKVMCVEVLAGAASNVSKGMCQLLADRGYAPQARTMSNIIFVDEATRAVLQV
jgi:FkbM family methyltransferase